jgi:hypothetical protein
MRGGEDHMYTQNARHPRAGVAVGLSILAAWLGALGLSALADDSGGVSHGGGSAGYAEAASQR